MEDYLGFDRETGRLVHLHVHFKLIFGQKHRKNYRLPLEEEMLATAIRDETYPIRICRPDLELLLLLLRAVLKVDFRPRAMARRFVRKLPLIPSNIVQEFRFLQERFDADRFEQEVQKWLPELRNDLMLLSREGLAGLPLSKLFSLQKRFLQSLKQYRLFSEKELQHELRVRRQAMKQSRVWLAHGGVSVAFVGADGAGKSSTVAEIKKWLGWKLSVRTAYMGLPKNVMAWKVFSLLARSTNTLRLSFISRRLNVHRWIWVAKQRQATYRRGEQLKNQGNVVLYDRFPLKEFWDMSEPMDGPRLQNGSLQKERERTIYDSLNLPDYVFLLRVDPESAISRKAESINSRKREQVEAKIAAVEKLAATSNPRFIVVDTMQGREKTLRQIKQELWDRI